MTTLQRSAETNTALRKWWTILHRACLAWDRHNTPRLGAAVAFYALLALSPMVLLVLSLLSLLVGRISAQAQMVGRVHWLVGLQESKAVSFLLSNANRPASGRLAWILGIATLILGLLGVAGEVRSGLNSIWVTDTPSHSRVVGLLRDKSVAVAMVLSMALLLTFSLLVSTALVGTGKLLASSLPVPGVLLSAASLVSSVGLTSALFAFMFRYVPATRPAWRDVLLGALLTGVLFTFGKAILDRYLAVSTSVSAYGAASSLIVITLWVYYSAQVFFFGAEFTHEYVVFEKDTAQSS